MKPPKLKTSIEAAEASPLTPPPAPPPQMPDFAVDPGEIALRSTVAGTFDAEGIAARALQQEARAELDWCSKWNQREADAIRQEQFSIQQRALENYNRLAALRHAGRELESELVTRAKLRDEQVAVKAQLDQAKALLSSPDALDLQDADLLRVKLETEHLPAKIGEIEKAITASSERIEKLVKASNCDRELFLAEMLRTGRENYRCDSTVIRLHGAGHLTL